MRELFQSFFPPLAQGDVKKWRPWRSNGTRRVDVLGLEGAVNRKKSRAASWSSRIQYVDILSGCTSVHPYNLGGNLFFAIPSNFALHLNAR